MFALVVTLSTLACLCYARPQEPVAAAAPAPAPPSGEKNEPIQIINQTDQNNPDGSFQFSFETANGIKIEEKGYLKEGVNASDKIQVIEGSASYTDNEGNPIVLRFIADENGFQPQGDHIPKAPESQLLSAQGRTQEGAPPAPSPAAPPAEPPAADQPAEPAPSEPALAESEA